MLFACTAVLAACAASEIVRDADGRAISKVAELKSTFGPEFTVTEVPLTGIDPKLLARAASCQTT